MSKYIAVFHIQHLRSKAQKSKQDFGKKRPARLSRKLKASRPVRKKNKTTKCHWNKLKKLLQLYLEFIWIQRTIICRIIPVSQQTGIFYSIKRIKSSLGICS